MLTIGNATITPIFEVDAGSIIQDGIPSATPEAIKQIAWLQPHYADAEGKCKAQVQTFLLEINGKKIVVDASCGDGRERPGLPTWGNMQTGFMERFATVWQPEDVNVVLTTHMHFDHVGWNVTLAENGKWRATFPNAEYIFNQTEFDYWNSEPETEMADDRMGFKESVLPMYQAGLAKLVPSNYQVCAGVSLIPSPGHTPGHVCVVVESEGQRAVISGDVLHHPSQIAHPDWGTPYDTNTEQANASRREILERFTDTGTIFIGSHFAEPVAGTIARDGDGFKLTPLA